MINLTTTGAADTTSVELYRAINVKAINVKTSSCIDDRSEMASMPSSQKVAKPKSLVHQVLKVKAKGSRISTLNHLPRIKYSNRLENKKRVRRKTTTEPISWTRAMMLLAVMQDKGQDNTRLMLACGFYLGLRVGDILQLTYEQLFAGELIIHEQKTGKQRRIYLNEGFRKIVRQVVSNLSHTPTGYVFVYNRRGQDKKMPISVTAANKRIRKVFAQYEIECKNPSSHCLRKTFGKHVFELMGKTDEALLILSEIFNHQGNLHVTKKYIGILEEQVQDVYRIL